MFWKPNWKRILGKDHSNVHVLLLKKKKETPISFHFSS